MTKVFISYSHDSDQHCEFVRNLSNRLRSEGLECLIDQYINGFPSEGWLRWMEDQVERADFVLMICTETYLRRFRGKENNIGKGVSFEGTVISQNLYDSYQQNTKFIPIIPEGGDLDNVPTPLKSFSTYSLPEKYDNLYRYLTTQPEHIAPPVGKIQAMPIATPKNEMLGNYSHSIPSSKPNLTGSSEKFLVHNKVKSNNDKAHRSNQLFWPQVAIFLSVTFIFISSAVSFYYFQIKTAHDVGQNTMVKHVGEILTSLELVEELELFVIDTEVISNESFDAFLDENFFSRGDVGKDTEYYGYIQSIESRAIAWSSKHPFELPIGQMSPYAMLKFLDFPLFEVTVTPGDVITGTMQPIMLNNRDPRSVPKSDLEYYVYAYSFTFQGKAFQLILAKSIKFDPEAEKLLRIDLTWLVSILTLLLLVFQLSISYAILPLFRRIKSNT